MSNVSRDSVHSGDMKSMHKEITYFWSVLAFIDILGQQDNIRAFDDLDLSDPGCLIKLKELDAMTSEFVETLRGDFIDFFNSYNQYKQTEINIPDDVKPLFDEMNKNQLEIQVFSDCIQGYASLQTRKYHSNAINGVFGLLMSCGSIMILSLYRRKVIRIGIEAGLTTKLSNGEVYGPALYKAHYLEHKVCQYPRIVIGEGLIKYLKKLSNKEKLASSQELIDLEWCKKIADLCLNMIIIDIDGVSIFDYLGATFVNSIIDEESHQVNIKEIFEPAYQFVNEEYSKYKEKKDLKLAQRYFILSNYFEKAKYNIKG